MEALTPPERLEHFVLALIPPAAREAVAGDLCETYRNPRQYALEALRTVPFVIASQARRNLNMPALLLQAMLAWLLLGGAAAALLIPVLALREAWRPNARPSATLAIRETMAIALLAMVFVQGLSFNIGEMQQMGLSRPAWFSLYLFGFLVAPLLCALRTGMIVSGDSALSGPRETSAAALAQDYQVFARRARRRSLLEGGALLAAAVLLQALSAMPMLTVLFALVGVWLLAHSMTPAGTAGTDFPSLRAHYKQALDSRQQLRRFLWWLWFAPPFLLLREKLEHETAAGHSVHAMMGAASMLLLCFLVTALNREQDGQAQEDIVALDRMAEAAPLAGQGWPGSSHVAAL